MTNPNIGAPANAFSNTFGRVMNISDGPLSGLTPMEKRRGEDHQSGENGHDGVDGTGLCGCIDEVRLARIVGGVGTDAAHGDAQRVETLSESTEEDPAVDLGKVGLEEKTDALPWHLGACSLPRR